MEDINVTLVHDEAGAPCGHEPGTPSGNTQGLLVPVGSVRRGERQRHRSSHPPLAGAAFPTGPLICRRVLRAKVAPASCQRSPSMTCARCPNATEAKGDQMIAVRSRQHSLRNARVRAIVSDEPARTSAQRQKAPAERPCGDRDHDGYEGVLATVDG